MWRRDRPLSFVMWCKTGVVAVCSLSSSILGRRKERPKGRGRVDSFWHRPLSRVIRREGKPEIYRQFWAQAGNKRKSEHPSPTWCGASLSSSVACSLCAVAFYVTCLACVPSLSVVCLVRDTDLPPVLGWRFRVQIRGLRCGARLTSE